MLVRQTWDTLLSLITWKVTEQKWFIKIISNKILFNSDISRHHSTCQPLKMIRNLECQSWKDVEYSSSGPLGPSCPFSESQNPRLKTYRTNEAGIMPGMPQGFNKLVTSLHREIAAMTLGAEQIDVVWNERQSKDQHPGRLEGVNILVVSTQCQDNPSNRWDGGSVWNPIGYLSSCRQNIQLQDFFPLFQ